MDAKQRKKHPLARGVLEYFPDALMAVANVSYVGNVQHNGPDAPMHWAKEKSTDHADCLLRHLVDRGTTDTDGLLHSAKVAWRALALLQIEIEEGRKQADFEYDNQLGANEVESTKVDPHKPVTFPGFPRKRRIYVAGPMRGIKDLNFPAFDSVRDVLNSGWTVISPADMDRQLGRGTNRDYAKRDTQAILECDAIFMLKGWEHSAGATAEHAVAKWAGLEIFYQGRK